MLPFRERAFAGIFFLSCLLLFSRPLSAQITFPGSHWQKYRDPTQAGWSPERLETARHYSDSIGAAAVMIVYKGGVLASWGDVQRKYLCHSMRKSFLNALYGMSVRDGQIDPGSSLEQLGIDDSVHPLTAAEKQATVQDLLEARSGIYLPAAYEGDPQKPPRGSHPHGTFWLYNNWDFNALGTILQKRTGVRFWDDLQKRIAAPLQMEDCDSLDIQYDYERKRSEHPAYTFKMSTRDLARFGLLYMCDGRWKDRQLVPASWIRESTTAYSVDAEGEGYGWLWWVDQTVFKDRGMYSAAGMGGHHIFIFPADSLVVVVRADTYKSRFVSLDAEYSLLQKILASRTGAPVMRPAMETLPAVADDPLMTYLPKPDPRRYVGRYQFEDEWMEILPGRNGLMMDTQFMGKFYLQQFGESLFMLKDREDWLSFIFDKNGKAIKLVYHDNSKISVSKN